MLVERYISDIITSYFGEYIQDIDQEQIRISAWRGGTIVLQDVQLRHDCISQHLLLLLLLQQRKRQSNSKTTPSDEENEEEKMMMMYHYFQSK